MTHVAVRQVVDRVDNVERVGDRSVQVSRGSRGVCRVLGVDEVEARGRLRGGLALGTLVRDDVVTGSRGRGRRTRAVPARGRGDGVLRVGNGLEALGQNLLSDGKDTVLPVDCKVRESLDIHERWTLTEALATKSVIEITLLSWASTNASTHAPVASFWI